MSVIVMLTGIFELARVCPHSITVALELTSMAIEHAQFVH